MCCFSREVEHVSNTSIFARAAEEGRQYVVYEMTIDAKEELAMILPIPVPPKPAEDAVKFINLKDYAAFFKDMKKGFTPPPSRGGAKADTLAEPAQRPKLKVE